MDESAVTGMYREIGSKVGFKSEANTYRFWRSHNIRKYFYNIVEDIVGREYADEWLGHVPGNVTRAYTRIEYRMKNAYMKGLPFLSLENIYSKDVNEKIRNLENEIDYLKKNL